VHNLGACGAQEHRAADKGFSLACQDPLMNVTVLLQTRKQTVVLTRRGMDTKSGSREFIFQCESMCGATKCLAAALVSLGS
jgi:hypothetical protein